MGYRHVLIVALLVTTLPACGSHPGPSPSPVPSSVTIHATLTDTVSGASIGGSEQVVSSLPARVTFTAAGHLDRTLTVSSATPTIDLIPDAAPFDLTFYRQFARNAFDAPETLEPTRRQVAAPNIYVRTVDEAGQSVDSKTIDTVAAAFVSGIELWTGHRFGVGTIDHGSDTKDGASGWITVKFLNPNAGNICGRATIGGGSIELNYLNPTCGCNGSKMRPRTVRHELGHAMGFWHTGVSTDLMSGLSDSRCDQLPSSREQYHAAILYARQAGNKDIDVDAGGALATASTEHRAVSRVVID